jgi:hypothetical protein
MPFTNTSFVRPQSDPFGPGNNQNSSFSKSGGEIRHMDQLPGMYMDRPPSFPTIPESPQTVSYYRDMMSNNGSNLPRIISSQQVLITLITTITGKIVFCFQNYHPINHRE